MIMNKAIYICASMALMLASCSSDETVELAKDKGISFRSVVGLNTRALNTTQDILEGNGMYVTTFDKAGNLVYPETHYELSGGVWTATPAQSWGGNDCLSFFLTYPKLDEWQKGTSKVQLTEDNKTVTVIVDEDIPQQKDYVAAYLKDAAKTQQGAAVSASLQHLLSSVEIWAKNDNGVFQYKVKGIRLNDVNREADIDLSTFGFTHKMQIVNYELTYDTPVILDGTAKSLMGTAGNAILIPQDGQHMTPWNGTVTKDPPTGPDDYQNRVGTHISVLINLTATAGAVIYPAGSTANNETYGWVAVPVTFGWESGKKYVYTLDFSDGAGKVDPRDPGDDVDPGGKDPNKAEPVLGGLIKFGLTVTEWNQDRNDVDLDGGGGFDATVDSWEDETTDDTILK